LHTAVFQDLNTVNDLNFFKCHFDLRSKSNSGRPGQHG
jgi:hypothetical protein